MNRSFFLQQYDMRRSRCMTVQALKASNCREEFIEINKFALHNITKDDELRDYNEKFDAVQIKPQSVHMKLRKSRTQTVKLKYKPARNYPLDIYILYDLTFSMRDDKETLLKMGGSLSKSLKNLTEHFRIGFGSFADKPIMPYIPEHSLDNPCRLIQDECIPTYGFKHSLPLTNNVQEFIAKVAESENTGNLDNLEGNFCDS